MLSSTPHLLIAQTLKMLESNPKLLDMYEVELDKCDYYEQAIELSLEYQAKIGEASE